MDVYNIKPDFIEQSDHSLERNYIDSTPKPVYKPQPQPQPPVVTGSSISDYVTQNKPMVIVAVSVIIVLLICLAYWYFSKSAAPTQLALKSPPVPPPVRQALPDNIPDPIIDAPTQPVKKPALAPAPVHHVEPDTTQMLHETLVTSVDDEELDKYMNPTETGVKAKAPPKETRESKPIKTPEPATIKPDEADLIDDLEDFDQ